MFAPLYDDSLDQRAPDVSTDSDAPTAQTQIPYTAASTTTTVETDAPTTESLTLAEQTASNTDIPAEEPIQQVPEPTDYDRNAFFNPFALTTNIFEFGAKKYADIL